MGFRESNRFRNKPFLTNGGDSNLEIAFNELELRTELSNIALLLSFSRDGALPGLAIFANTKTSTVDSPGSLNVYSNEVSFVDP